MSFKPNQYKQRGNWHQGSEQQSNLRTGLCGLFFTVDADEKRGVKEARNLIDHFLTIKNESEQSSTATKDIDGCDGDKAQDPNPDISDSLNTACQQIQQKGAFGSRGNRGYADIRQFTTGARCSLFFTSPMITEDNVYGLAEKMVEKCQHENWNRFLARVIPVEETCSAYMDQILSSMSKLISKHLTTDSSQTSLSPSYAIDFKASNTKLIKREQIYDEVGKLMKELVPTSTVNLTQPDFLLVIHTIRTVTLLAIVRNFYQLRKFSLRPPTENEETKKEHQKQNTEKEQNASTSADEIPETIDEKKKKTEIVENE